MKRKGILTILLFSLLGLSSVFAYDISKKYDYSYAPEYAIRVTDEISYYTNDNGDLEYYDTVLIVDYDSSTIYELDCSSQNEALSKYRELINKYSSASQIKNKLIPSLQDKVKYLSTSDNGKWLYCTLDESLFNDK